MTTKKINLFEKFSKISTAPPPATLTPITLGVTAPQIDLMDAFKNKPLPLNFVLPALVAGTVGAIVSPGGAGKSMLALELLIYVASNCDLTDITKHFGEHDPRYHGKVAFLAAEDPAVAIQHRLYSIAQMLRQLIHDKDECQYYLELIAENIEISTLLGMQPDIGNSQWFDYILRMATDKRLLVLDTLRRFHTYEENDSGEMSHLLGMLERITQKTGCSIVFLHHSNKSAAMNGQGDMQQASRGSSVLVDNVRWQMFVAGMSKAEADALQVSDELRGHYVRAGVSKQNYGKPIPETWLRRGEGGVLVPAEFATSRVTTAVKPKTTDKEKW